MDTARLNKLADVIEGLTPSRFNMAFYAAEWDPEFGPNHPDTYEEIEFLHPGELGSKCNTAGCIGGWAISEFSDEGTNYPGDYAHQLLGLKYLEGMELFCGNGYTTEFWTQFGIPEGKELDTSLFTTELVADALRQLANGSVELDGRS